MSLSTLRQVVKHWVTNETVSRILSLRLKKWQSFANDTITVTGWGSPSRDTNDNLQAWFDPAKKVEILFTLIGGEEHPVDGKLPLHHSVVSDNFEHRFTIKLGDARGFVVVTEQRCGFP